jgi:hypothetical protein
MAACCNTEITENPTKLYRSTISGGLALSSPLAGHSPAIVIFVFFVPNAFDFFGVFGVFGGSNVYGLFIQRSGAPAQSGHWPCTSTI